MIFTRTTTMQAELTKLLVENSARADSIRALRFLAMRAKRMGRRRKEGKLRGSMKLLACEGVVSERRMDELADRLQRRAGRRAAGRGGTGRRSA